MKSQKPEKMVRMCSDDLAQRKVERAWNKITNEPQSQPKSEEQSNVDFRGLLDRQFWPKKAVKLDKRTRNLKTFVVWPLCKLISTTRVIEFNFRQLAKGKRFFSLDKRNPTNLVVFKKDVHDRLMTFRGVFGRALQRRPQLVRFNYKSPTQFGWERVELTQLLAKPLENKWLWEKLFDCGEFRVKSREGRTIAKKHDATTKKSKLTISLMKWHRELECDLDNQCWWICCQEMVALMDATTDCDDGGGSRLESRMHGRTSEKEGTSLWKTNGSRNDGRITNLTSTFQKTSTHSLNTRNEGAGVREKERRDRGRQVEGEESSKNKNAEKIKIARVGRKSVETSRQYFLQGQIGSLNCAK